MISMCCVCFASLDVVCDELMIVTEILVCSSFLINVCIFIVSKALLSDCSRRGSHLVEPLCYGIVYCV